MINIFFYIRDTKVKNISCIYYGLSSGKSVITRKSTGIKIPTSCWSSEKGTLKSSKSYDVTQDLLKLNNLREDLLRKYVPKKKVTTDDNDCFISYFESSLSSNQFNVETSIKYGVILNMLKRFVKFRYETNKLPISLMRDLDFGYEFRDFVVRPPDNYSASGVKNRRLKTTTINNYISVINTFIKNYNEQYQRKNPISYFPKDRNKKNEEPIPTALYLDEIRKLESYQPQNTITRSNGIKPEKLKMSKWTFLFQFYCLGMRISDCLLMRTTHFSSDGIRYYMKKTRQFQTIPPHISITNQLKEIFPEEFEVSENETLLGNIQLSGNDMKDYLMKMSVENARISQLSLKEVVEIKEKIDNAEIGLKDYLDFLNRTIEKMGNTLSSRFFQLIGKRKDDFIFPYLKIQDFKGVSVKASYELNELQNAQLHKSRVLYNKYLAIISDELELDKKLTGHTPRHSFANILHENDAHPEEISLTLGHKNLTTTIKYMKRFPDKVRTSGIEKFRRIQ